MHDLSHRLRPLVLALAAPAVLLLAACTTPAASGGPASTVAPATPTNGASSPAATTASGSPRPTDMQVMSVTMLPALPTDVDPASLEVACEESTDGTAIPCDEAAELGARIMRLMSSAPIDWIAIERPVCASACTEQELKSVTITAQAPGEEGSEIFTFDLDMLNGVFTFPVENPDATFPPAT